jgi:predicted MPP superfamily phosphohydrolase
MKPRILAIIAVVLLLFGSLNYYVGLRLWQWASLTLPLNGWWFGLVFGLISCSFLIGRIGGRWLPRPVSGVLTRVGGYWFLILLYAPPLLLLVEVGRLLNLWLGFVPQKNLHVVALTLGLLFCMFICILLLYGVWRARNPVVVTYELEIPKSGGKHRELQIALVSDTHLGATNGIRRLRHMVQMVNALEPDLILHAGDLIDDEVQSFIHHNMVGELERLKAKLGTYIILGNHDYPAGYTPEYRELLAGAGVKLLLDEAVQVDDSFYLAGRDDWSGKSRVGRPRKPLAEILEAVDKSRPLILMDHQPNRLEEAKDAGIDLQVSGHTHRGQMFPNQFLTRRVFEIDWGYLKKGALHVIVSLGFGTWGPPVRIGNRPEVVSIRVRFTG